MTLFAYLIQVGGNVWLNRGFESDGAVDLGGAKIGGNLHFDSGRFVNPGNVAIAVPGASVDGVIFLTSFGPGDEVEVDGVANFSSDRVGDSFIVDHVKFDGSVGDQHGFEGAGMTVARSFIWHHVILQNDAQFGPQRRFGGSAAGRRAELARTGQAADRRLNVQRSLCRKWWAHGAAGAKCARRR